jgi:hypothetical protein
MSRIVIDILIYHRHKPIDCILVMLVSRSNTCRGSHYINLAVVLVACPDRAGSAHDSAASLTSLMISKLPRSGLSTCPSSLLATGNVGFAESTQ